MVITVTMNPAMDKTLVLDGFTLGEVNRVVLGRNDIGGKGINVSKVLKEFGEDSLALGFLGGILEEVFLKELKTMGIGQRFVPVKGSTRTNIKVVDRVKGTFTDINEPGPVIQEEELTEFLQLYRETVTSGDVVVLSGGVSEGIPVKIYRLLTEIAKEKGALVALDAEGDLFREALEAKPDMVKPNDRELALYLGKEHLTEDEIVDAAKELVAKGISKVLVSRGEKGSILATAEGILKAEGLKVPVKSTVGAGDSMVAALIYSVLKGFGPRETLAMAQAAGAAAVMTEGTKACTLQEVESLLQAATEKIKEEKR